MRGVSPGAISRSAWLPVPLGETYSVGMAVAHCFQEAELGRAGEAPGATEADSVFKDRNRDPERH